MLALPIVFFQIIFSDFIHNELYTSHNELFMHKLFSFLFEFFLQINEFILELFIHFYFFSDFISFFAHLLSYRVV